MFVCVENKTARGYLQVRRQLVRGEDAQLELREADLQVLKVVTFGCSCVLTGLVMEVLVRCLQLCTNDSFERVCVLIC